MIQVENIDVWNAICAQSSRKCRQKSGKYEAYVSMDGKTTMLGTYATEEEAIRTTNETKYLRFASECVNVGLNVSDGKVYQQNYVVFPNGKILNLYGKEMIGAIDRCGYRHGIFNKKNRNFHRIIAETFLDNPMGMGDVNHKNGIKTDNRVENLEWCTRSQNVKHAYENDLEKKMCGENHFAHKLTEKDVRYAREVYKFRDKRFGIVPLAKKFGVNRSTMEKAIKGKAWCHVV